MDNSIYASLNRQSGLMQEMQAIANNIANSDTTGFRKEGVVFSEHIARLGRQEPTLAMADASARMIDLRNGALQNTGGALDIALDGEGFFRLATPQGERLTRAGSFTLSPEGQIVSSDGSALLDSGGATVTIPPGFGPPAIARDGAPFPSRVPQWRRSGWSCPPTPRRWSTKAARALPSRGIRCRLQMHRSPVASSNGQMRNRSARLPG